MKYLWHKLIADGLTCFYQGTEPDLDQALGYLQRKLNLEALYLHMIEVIPGDHHWTRIRREEEHGNTVFPATKGVFTDIDSLSPDERKLLVLEGYLEEKDDQGVLKVFLKDKFDEKRSDFLSDPRLQNKISAKRLETIYELLRRTRRHYRRIRLSELRDDLCSHLVSMGLALDDGKDLKLKGAPELLEAVVFPEHMELTVEELTRIRGVLVAGARAPLRTIPRDALKTRDPMAETLFGETGRIIVGEKGSKDHKHLTYKVRIGRYILSVVPKEEDQYPRALELLMHSVHLEFLTIMKERLQRELNDLEMSRLNGIKERLKKQEGINKKEIQSYVRETLQEFFIIGNTYCDITRGAVSLIPVDEQYEPCIDKGPYKDFAGTVSFQMTGGLNSISTAFSELGPDVGLGQLSSSRDVNVFCCESVIDANSVWQQYTFESCSENNFKKNGGNCFSDYLSTVQKLMQRIVDLTVKELAFKKVELLANTDPLTGIFNRRHVTEVIINWFKQQLPGIVLGYIDIDNFNHFNDDLSHDFGDDILRWLSGIFKENSHPDCVVGRLGGDEFVCAAYQSHNDVMGARMKALFHAITKTPIPFTLTLRKEAKESRQPFTDDLITLFYRLLELENGELVERDTKHRLSKRSELITTYVILLSQCEKGMNYEILKRNVAGLAKFMGIEEAHASTLTPSKVMELMAEIISTVIDEGGSTGRSTADTQVLVSAYEFMISQMLQVLQEKMIKQMGTFFPVTKESEEEFIRAIKVFLTMQLANIQDTDSLRPAMIDALGTDQVRLSSNMKISMGVVSADEHHVRDFNALINRADKRMYQVKHGGKNDIFGA